MLGCAAAVHAPALDTYFAQDDVTFLARARGLVPTPWSLARPLSEGWTWRLLDGAFGLDPFPYHVFNFALHLLNTALVFAIGVRLLNSRVAGFVAALLFGASSIAFTPLHWASGLVELMVSSFALAAFLLYLVTRAPWLPHAAAPATAGQTPEATAPLAPAGRWRPVLMWLSALFVLGALLSKESAILFPLALLVANRRLDPRATARAAVPQLAATLLYAVGFLATLRLVHYVGSEVYSMSKDPRFIALNLATYLGWLVSLWVPVRDAVAAMNPDGWHLGLPVALAIGALLWSQRRARTHPEEVAAAWFFAFLAPVAALQHHTYLYYLYLPWPGMCWLVAGAGQRMMRKPSPVLAWAAVLLLATFVGVEVRNVWARERLLVGPFPRDKTVRESMLLENAIRDLRAARLAPGDRVAFINPAPRRHYAVGDTTVAVRRVRSYVPLEGALRQGEALRVFLPGIEYLGFGKGLPPEWENVAVFLYQDHGALRLLGRGSRALTELGTFTLRTRNWGKADSMFLRARALGDTTADATFGLIITSDLLGRAGDSERYAREFLGRWPGDSRAPAVASTLTEEETKAASTHP